MSARPPDDVHLPWYDTRAFMQDQYGEVLHRVPVDAGLSCPHRGTEGGGGCTFCAPNGARAVQLGDAAGLEEQVRRAVRFARRRYGARRFMAYVQAYTGTLAPVEEQRERYRHLLSLADFSALSIGTRPDCLGEGTLALLQSLRETLDVWVELGVQSIHDRTLREIHRGHDWACSREAIVRLAERGVRPVVHLILGLPGESRDDMCATIRTLVALPIGGLKLHDLHIVKGSAMEAAWRERPFPLPGDLGYVDLLAALLPQIPAGIPLMRLRTDTPDEARVAPASGWSKGEFLQALAETMRRRGLRQGDACPGATERPRPLPEAVATRDGSVTLWSPEFKEHYHSKVGARAEARDTYVSPSRLTERLRAGTVRVLDLCFGMGYNALTALQAAIESRAGARLEITGIELDWRVVRHAAQLIQPLEGDAFDWGGVLTRLAGEGQAQVGDGRLSMLWGDARLLLRGFSEGSFDLVFHDPFSTQRCAELWSVELFRELYRVLSPRGGLWTYSVAVPVRAGLLEAGFAVGETRDPQGRAVGTHAMVATPDVAAPLSEATRVLIHETPRGIPYRDPPSCWSNRRILAARQEALTAWTTCGHGPTTAKSQERS